MDDYMMRFLAKQRFAEMQAFSSTRRSSGRHGRPVLRSGFVSASA